MSTDFSYDGKQILISGPIKPNGKDMPNDARTRVESYADIASIPNPYVGLKITVKVDETNNNKMTDYIVKSLKANSIGLANTVIDEVVRYVDYLGVSAGGGSGEGLTSEQAQQLQTAYNHSQSDHVQASDIPSLDGYATETFVTSKIAEASLSGGEVDLSGYATKDDLKTKANTSHTHTTSDVTDLNLSNIDAVSLNGKKFSEPMTKQEYDAIADKDPNTIYLVDDNNVVTGVPDYSTADANKLLAVNSTGTALAWVNAPSGSGTGLTAEQVNQLATAYSHSQSHHVANSDIPTKTSQLFNDSGFLTEVPASDIETAVNDYMTKNPISMNDFWADLSELEKMYLDEAPSIKDIRVEVVQGDKIVYNTDNIDTLRGIINVYKVYTDDSEIITNNYILTGSLAVGNSAIFVLCEGISKKINITATEEPSLTVSSISATYSKNDRVDPSINLYDLRHDLVVTVTYDNSTTVKISGYNLTGELEANSNSILTISYRGQETTIQLAVGDYTGYVVDSLEAFYNFTTYEEGYTGVISDLSNNETECKIQDQSYKEGIRGFSGKKLMLDNSGSKISINSSAQRDVPFTIEMAFSPRSNYNNNKQLTSFTGTRFELFRTNFAYDGSTSSGQIRVKLDSLTPTGSCVSYSSGAYEANTSPEVPGLFVASSNGYITTPKIYHLSFVCRGKNKDNDIYINGNKVLTANNGNFQTFSGSKSCIQIYGGMDLYMLRVYNSALSEKDITRNFKQVNREIKEVSK